MTSTPAPAARVLVADDEPSIRYVLRETLEAEGYEVTDVDNGEAALAALSEAPHQLAFLDIRMPGPSGLELLERLQALGSETAVVIITAQNTFENAVEAMKRGALDYLVKPFSVAEVKALAAKAVRTRALEREVHALRREVGRRSVPGDRLVGRSPELLEIFKTVGKIAARDVSVLITGESGTGKELVARAIHAASMRAEGPFVAINTAAIPASCWRASSSATSGVPSRARWRRARAASERPTAEPSSSTRSATCPSTSRPSCCACCRAAR